MKKTVQQEINVCDFCGTSEDVFEKCEGCGKDACSGCEGGHFRRFEAKVFSGGAGSACYCPECEQKARTDADRLYAAYSKVESLTSEWRAFEVEFQDRKKRAETEVKMERERRHLRDT